MKIKKRRKKKWRSPREILGDRALMAGLLFSLVVHAVVIFQVSWTQEKADAKGRRLMVARLVRLPRSPVPSSPAAPEEAALPPVAAREIPQLVSAEETEAPEDKPEDKPERGGDNGSFSVAARRATAMKGARAAGGVSLSVPAAATKIKEYRLRAQPAAAGRGRASIALATPSGPDRSVATALAEIRRMIDSEKSYPLLAMRNGWEGRVLVELSITDGGSLADVRVVGASGYGILDSATVKAVRRAGPFPPLDGKVRVPVTYRLEHP